MLKFLTVFISFVFAVSSYSDNAKKYQFNYAHWK